MLYSLYLLPEIEAVEVVHHLQRCVSCLDAVLAIRQALAELPDSAEQWQPHPRVRERLLDELAGNFSCRTEWHEETGTLRITMDFRSR